MISSHEKVRHMGNDQAHKTDGTRCVDHEAHEHRDHHRIDRAEKSEIDA